MPQSRKSAEAMRSALDEFKKSGLSLYAFARERRIPYATLRYWKRRADAATDPNRPCGAGQNCFV